MFLQTERVFLSVVGSLADPADDVVRRALAVLAEICSCHTATTTATTTTSSDTVTTTTSTTPLMDSVKTVIYDSQSLLFCYVLISVCLR